MTFPDPVTNVVTSYSADNFGITITWDPYVDNGDAVDKAAIYIQESDGTTYALDQTDCDGNQTTVYSTRTCTIPMASLRASPFNLVVLD